MGHTGWGAGGYLVPSLVLLCGSGLSAAAGLSDRLAAREGRARFANRLRQAQTREQVTALLEEADQGVP